MEKIKHLVKSLCSITLRFAIILIVSVLVLRFAGSFWQDPREEHHYDYAAFNDRIVESAGIMYNCGAIMVQLDLLCDALGAEVSKKGRTITINWQDNELIIKLYSKKATLNGETFYQDNAPTYENGNVFIHIRTIWEDLGLRTSHKGLCEFAFDDNITSQNHIHFYSWDYLNARENNKEQ